MGQDTPDRKDQGGERKRNGTNKKENQEENKTVPNPTVRMGLKPAKWKPASRIILRTPKTKASETAPQFEGSSTVRLSPTKRIPLASIIKKPYASLRDSRTGQSKDSADIDIRHRATLKVNFQEPTLHYSPATLRRLRDHTSRSMHQIIGDKIPIDVRKHSFRVTSSARFGRGEAILPPFPITSVPSPERSSTVTAFPCSNTKKSLDEEVALSISIETPRPAKSPARNEKDIEDSPCYADAELSGEELESKMRALLARDARQTPSAGNKSVKWDPAIVACGPLASITNKSKTKKPRARQLSEAPAKKIDDNLNDFASIVAELKKGDRKLLEHILDTLKDISSSDDSVIIPKPVNRAQRRKSRVKSKSFDDIDDIEDVVQPLDERNLNKKPKSVMTMKPIDDKKGSSHVKSLNPEAPAFRNFADIKTRSSPQKENIRQEGQWPLNVQRKRPHSSEEVTHNNSLNDQIKHKYIPPALRTRPGQMASEPEPVWINTSKPFLSQANVTLELHTPGFQTQPLPFEWLQDYFLNMQNAMEQSPLTHELPGMIDGQQNMFPMPPFLPPPWLSGFPFGPMPFSYHTMAPMLPLGWTPGIDLQSGLVHPILPPEWCPVPIVPPPTLPLSQYPTATAAQVARKQLADSMKASKNPISSENEHGRTAHVLEPAWAKTVLEQFTEKFPKTGKAKPPRPIPKPSKKREKASEIQQRLEFLLYHEKERRALQQLNGQAPFITWEGSDTFGSSDSSSRDSSMAVVQSSPPKAPKVKTHLTVEEIRDSSEIMWTDN